MKSALYIKIEDCTAARKDREQNRNLALRNPEFLLEVIETAFNIQHPNHHKACWILELICERKLKLFLPHIDLFLEVIPEFKNDSAVRAASRIAMFLAKSNHRANGISLSQLHETQLIEACLDWVIRDEKVAAKVYSFKALFVLGKKYPWVHDEIKTILEQEYVYQSPAFQAVARQILKKMKVR